MKPSKRQAEEERYHWVCGYRVPCGNCDKTYKSKRAFTRSQRTASLSEHNKSTLTDHATQENHVIDWAKATVVDRESHRPTRWIKEAVHIHKEDQQAMNRDEGSYQLSHAYDHFLTWQLSVVSGSRRTEYQLSSDEGLWKWPKHQGFLWIFGCVIWIC